MANEMEHLTTMSSYRQVAERLGLSLRGVQVLAEQGHLTAVRVGKRSVRIRDWEVEQYISGRAAEATQNQKARK